MADVCAKYVTDWLNPVIRFGDTFGEVAGVDLADHPHIATFCPVLAEEHQRRTGHVVALPMAVEGLTTLALLARQPVGVTWYLPWIGAILLAVALGCTVFLSVPLHAKMATNPDAQVGAKLVATNWPRTIAWSLRAMVCVVMVAQMVNSR